MKEERHLDYERRLERPKVDAWIVVVAVLMMACGGLLAVAGLVFLGAAVGNVHGWIREGRVAGGAGGWAVWAAWMGVMGLSGFGWILLVLGYRRVMNAWDALRGSPKAERALWNGGDLEKRQ